VRIERRRFTTMTRDLQDLAAWLRQLQVTHVAIESTGVYWKPVECVGRAIHHHPGERSAH
jgi:hypothetical protein